MDTMTDAIGSDTISEIPQWGPPASVTEALMGHPDTRALVSIAASAAARPEDAARFATHRVAAVRSAAARNGGLPESAFAALAADSDPGVRRAAASNPNCPVAALDTLSHDGDISVQTAVAHHASCSAQALETLASGRSLAVRRMVAHHPNTTAETLARLGSNSDRVVRMTAQQHRSFPQDSLPPTATNAQMRDADCDPAVLDAASTHPEVFVRRLVGQHPNTSVETLRKLSKDRSWGVVAGVAHHRNCPPDIVDRLASRKNDNVRLAALSNPRCSPATLAAALRGGGRHDQAAVLPNPALGENLIREFFAADPVDDAQVPGTWRYLVMNPSCPPDLLADVAQKHDRWIRLIVAAHGNCTDAVLAVLADDPEEQIRDAARLRMAQAADAVDMAAVSGAAPGQPAAELSKAGPRGKRGENRKALRRGARTHAQIAEDLSVSRSWVSEAAADESRSRKSAKRP